MGTQVGNQAAFFPISAPTPRRGVGNGKTEVGNFPLAEGVLGKWERESEGEPEPTVDLARVRAFSDRSNITQIWLLMLHEGGRWASGEIAKTLGMKPPAVYMALNAMTTRGFAVRFDSPNGFRYGVSAACGVPQGMKLEDLRGAL
jgi:hypothetical protein